ncbi:MAG: nucleotide exchange factor GrpE [Actinobacteria bacterium]|nr:nucleotide exchange factor GrpE [Actinomycetota bacterium]
MTERDEELAEDVVGIESDPTAEDGPSDEELVGGPVSTDDGPAPGADAADEASELQEPEEEAVDWGVLAEQDPRSPGELLAELTEAEARRDEYLEDVRRARAEFENYRKRVLREGTAQRDQGRADVVARLLDVLDDFDRTLAAAGENADDGFVKGVSLVREKLVGTLRDLGLTRIDEVGVPFDPNRHEAVQQVEAEEPVDGPTVAELFRPGYELGGRVLRPAMVVVQQ